MRLIQVLVPDEHQNQVFEVLDEQNFTYVTTEEARRDGYLVLYFPLPTEAVEDILAQLRDIGLDESEYTVITDIETATTPNIGELEKDYVEESEDVSRISHAELRSSAHDLKPDTLTFVSLAILSAIVATTGLLLESAIVITGAMVIAPFVGAALSASIGAVISDRTVLANSIKYQILGLTAAIVSASITSYLLKVTSTVPTSLAVIYNTQINSFSTPNLLVLLIAIGAGAAGALALTTDISTALAGVAVAAALVPAAATVGVTIVWVQPGLALSALFVLFVNILFINLSAYVTFLILGYRPSGIASLRPNLSQPLRTSGYTLFLGVSIVVIVITIFVAAQYFLFVQTTNSQVNDVLTQSEYQQLELIEITRTYSDPPPFGQKESVTVVIARPAGQQYPQLAERLQQQIERNTDHQVTVQVRFIDYQRSNPSS
ncbi:TIGR00341 family protein [Haladaptatus halobius]|uniref:TIGR00341 family protein n=1 Tax=Haladaptatus halobius TaxID=2884875 RepID=UPI001D0AA2D1|nr:TIGR00341 family protein [Haladaptatus halobius]